MNYLRRFLDQTDPTASLKHAAYALAVAASCGWLSYDILRTPMTANWVAAFAAFLAAVVTGKVAGPKVGVAAPSTPGAVATSVERVGTSQNPGSEGAGGGAQ